LVIHTPNIINPYITAVDEIDFGIYINFGGLNAIINIWVDTGNTMETGFGYL